jgi:DNA modification methylase
MRYENKDCLEFLKSLDDESVDLVIVDPPYFEIIKDDWDNQWNSEQEYLDWCMEWTTECFRVLKPGRCFYVWGTTKEDTFLRYKLDVLNKQNNAHYQNWIIWHYDWGGRTKKNFARKHEDLLMYSKGKEFLFNADDVLEERAVKTNMALQRKMNLLKKRMVLDEKIDNEKYSKLCEEYDNLWKEDFDPNTVSEEHKKDYEECLKYWTKSDEKSWKTYRFDKLEYDQWQPKLEELQAKNTKFEKGKIPTDVWKKNNHTTSKEYAGWHPTQKPVALLERIIKANSNEGDVVLDVFNGSGSTTIACNKVNRTFWGCEFDKEYYEKSLKRIEEMEKYYKELENV